MDVKSISDNLNLKILSGEKGMGSIVSGGYVSDLLSDVIGNAQQGDIWITLQSHLNIVAVASLKDIAAIIIVRRNLPDKDTIEKSNIENIPILSTEMDAFNAAGKLFNLLGKG